MRLQLSILGLSLCSFLLLTQCTPDFGLLTSGGGGAAGQGGCADASCGGNGAGGTSAVAGTSGTGTAGSGRAGSAGGEPLGGAAGEPNHPGGLGGGGAGTGAVGGSAAEPGAAGAGGQDDGGRGGQPNVGGGGGSGPCITAFPGGQVKYNFNVDPGATVMMYPEDSTGTGSGCSGPVASSVVSHNAEQGHMCPGAEQISIPFGPLWGDQKASVVLNFSASDWTAFTRLHAWVKVVTPELSVPKTETLDYIDSLKFSVASGSNYAFFYAATSPPTPQADREWHEITLSLTPNSQYDPTVVLNVALQFTLRYFAPPAGPEAPPVTTVLLDDIWLE